MPKLEVEKVNNTDPHTIQLHQKNFYECLFNSKQDQDFLIPNIFMDSDTIPVLNKTQKYVCDQPITILKLEKVLSAIKNTLSYQK